MTRLSKQSARGRKPERLRALLPDVWALMKPRRGLLAVAFLLMAVSRVAGLVLPASTKYLIDDVIGRRQVALLLPLVGAVVAATVVQGLGSFALVQLVSKAAQQLIADMRIRVQEHVGRLPVAFHDANKTGDLVSRIMNDVEGFRNLVGTGLIELAGGLLTASLAFAVMLRISPRVTLLTLVALAVFGLVVFRGFRVLRPVFRERGQMYAEVTGRLTESLGGVRVVKGYHAEAREAAVFEGGVRRILDNVFRTLATTSALSLSSTVLLGLVGAGVMYVGASEILAGRMTVGSFFTYTVFLGFLVGPFFQVATIGAQLTEALAGLERTREILRERPEDEDPRRSVALPGAAGRGGLRGRRLRLSRGRAGAARRLAPGRAGDGHRARGTLGSGQVHDDRPRLRLPHADLGPRPRGRGGPRHGQARLVPPPPRRRPAGDLPLRRHHPRERRLLPPRGRRGGDPRGLPHRPRRRVRRGLRGRVRHGGGRAGRPPLGRAAAAGGHRAGDPRGPADPDPRRGHVEPRLGVRGAHPGGPLLAHEGPHDVRDRPPPLDDPPGRPDPRGREGGHRRARHARGAARGGRALPRDVRPAARAAGQPLPRARRGRRGRGGARGAGRAGGGGRSVRLGLLDP